MTVKRKGALAGRHNMHGAAELGEAKQRRHRAPFRNELLAIAAIKQRHIDDVDDGLFGH